MSSSHSPDGACNKSTPAKPKLRIFTALHITQGGISHEKNVSPSVYPPVRPSVKRVNCDIAKESSASIYVLYDWPIIIVFRQEEWLVGDDPSMYLKF